MRRGIQKYKLNQSYVIPSHRHSGNAVHTIALNQTNSYLYPDIEYKLTDHLGSTRMSYKLNFTCAGVYQNATINYMADYFSFGKIVREYINAGTAAEKYQYTGKERDTESGYDYFNARNYHSEVGRFLSVDPLAGKYPGWSSYNYTMNNPINMVDPDGMEADDIVYFDSNGNETERIVSTTEFRAFVETGASPNGTVYTEAVMPNQTVMANGKMGDYENLDYQIAASTFIVNNDIKNGMVNGTLNHQFTNDSKTPKFSPNLTKAMAIEESDFGKPGPNGTGSKDPIMANYPGDFKFSADVKSAAGLTKNQVMDANTSIQGGLKILLLKGMNSDKGGNYTTWKGNREALTRYGPGGTNYADRILSHEKSLQNGNKIKF